MSTVDLSAASRILVCLRWGIGDVVMELPLLHALRRSLPHARITALGAPPAIELLEGDPCVDEIASVADFGFRHWGDAGDEVTRRRFAEWCDDARFQYVLDGSHASRGVQMALRSKTLGWLDTGAYLGSSDGEVGNGLSALARAGKAAWGVDVPDARPQLMLHPAERSGARGMRRQLCGDAPVLALAAMASSPLKRGAAAEFARAADMLVSEHHCRVLVFAGSGAEDGREVLETMVNRSRGQVVEPQNLRRTAALLAQCRVLICNDTGIMHLAAAVSVPVVSVFACTSPRLYLPPGGTAVERWQEPCAFLEAWRGGFGVTPCVEAGRCLRADHRRVERWADAAATAASAALIGAPTGAH